MRSKLSDALEKNAILEKRFPKLKSRIDTAYTEKVIELENARQAMEKELQALKRSTILPGGNEPYTKSSRTP